MASRLEKNESDIKLKSKESTEPCSCGSPFRDYDDRCLRCKKMIDQKRASALPFHRKISEIPICKCSTTTLKSWGQRKTTIEELELCNFCDSRIGGEVEDVEDLAAKELAAEKAKAALLRSKKLDEEILRVITDAKNGTPVYLYRSIYVSVDSFNNFGGKISSVAAFNDLQVKAAGAQGWRVVEAIPRTSGETLENFEGFGKAWAGGIGGSVVGAYVLMEFVVTASNAEASAELIRETVSQYLV